jgi:hypothetical protein
LQQKSGCGEGLIYNIPSAHFQTTAKEQKKGFSPKTVAPRKGLIIEGQTSGNMRDDTSRRTDINEPQ